MENAERRNEEIKLLSLIYLNFEVSGCGDIFPDLNAKLIQIFELHTPYMKVNNRGKVQRSSSYVERM